MSKLAAVEPVPPVSRMSPDDLAVASNKDALKQVIQAGMFGLGLGASGRALMGLKDMFTRTPYTPPRVGLRPSVVEINLPQEQEEEERRKLRKTAEGPVFQGISDFLNRPSNYSVINWLKGLKPTGDLLAWPTLSPGAPLSKPWFMPSVVGAATLGTLGGYKAVGAGLDSMEEQRRKNELENTKREYRNALVEQYSADKRASDNPATLLDNVADKFIKQAGWGELVGAGTGAYLTLAGLLASGAGYGTYNWVKSRSPENRLARAIKQRERLRWATRPPEIYAVTKPMPPGQTTALEDEDQEVKDEDQASARRAPMMPKLGADERAVAALYKSSMNDWLPDLPAYRIAQTALAKPALSGPGLSSANLSQPSTGTNFGKPAIGSADRSMAKPGPVLSAGLSTNKLSPQMLRAGNRLGLEVEHSYDPVEPEGPAPFRARQPGMSAPEPPGLMRGPFNPPARPNMNMEQDWRRNPEPPNWKMQFPNYNTSKTIPTGAKQPFHPAPTPSTGYY